MQISKQAKASVSRDKAKKSGTNKQVSNIQERRSTLQQPVGLNKGNKMRKKLDSSKKKLVMKKLNWGNFNWGVETHSARVVSQKQLLF